MSSVSPRRSRFRTCLLWAAPLTWLGCGGGGGTDIVLPSLSVTTATDGIELDPDGYNLVIDGSQGESIGVGATRVVDRLSDGQHTIGLSGLAANCSTQSENPQTVTIRSGATTSVAFAIRCGASSGTIEVATSTSGTGSDPDGFSVMLDGTERGPIATSATAAFAGIPIGAHSVSLAGVSTNCQVTGENPRNVTVGGGQTAQVPFAVTCTGPAPSTGTLEVITATTGSDQDPDGYSVSVDAGAGQSVGLNASLSLPGITATRHSVQLTGVAANCTVAGTNPRQATVPAAGSITVRFAITCARPPAGTGSIEITTATTGSTPDPDGYTVSIDGGSGQPIAVGGSRAVGSISPGTHAVQLNGVAPNCTVSDNPRTITVTAGQATAVAFAITCTTPAPTSGNLRINVGTTGGSPDPDGYSVSIDSGNPQNLATDDSRTVQGLTPGAHSVLLGGVAANCSVAGENPKTFTISAGQTATVAFSVTCAATGASVNLRIQGMYLTQSTQDLTGSVPLVQGRDGYLRVFVTASSSNSVRPGVRVRFFRSGGSTPIQTFTIAAPGASTPTAVQEGALQGSWNIRVPAPLIQPNTTVLADVDPENAVAETNESDNSFPAAGNPKALSVQSAPAAIIRLVPIRQTANNLQGSVTAPDQLLDLTRRMYPLGNVTAEVRQAFTVTGPLQPFDENRQWNQILSDLEALRVTDDATDRTYYGLVRLDYNSGIVGNGFVGAPSAIGTDAPGDVRRIMAHELGHTWGQLHTPCGTPPGVDPRFPYRSGNIGVYGYDLSSGALKPPSLPDIMGYCENPWISDYIYQQVMNYRRSNPLTAGGAGLAQPCLLVWGRIENGQAVLEPTFQITTRPRLPRRAGPYTLEARASDGSDLFSVSFEATPTGDDTRDSKHFAFAIPIDQARAGRLGSMRLTGPGVQLAGITQSAKRLQRGAAGDDVTARGETGAVTLQWDAAAHPMIMVRDPDTGEVLSFARGGNARVLTTKSAVDLEVSNGVQSHRVRLAISR